MKEGYLFIDISIGATSVICLHTTDSSVSSVESSVFIIDSSNPVVLSADRTTSGMIHFESDAPHLGEPLTNEGIYRRLGEPGW